MSVKNSSDTIGNRTCDIPACSAVPQPTAPPRAAGHTWMLTLKLHERRGVGICGMAMIGPGVDEMAGLSLRASPHDRTPKRTISFVACENTLPTEL